MPNPNLIDLDDFLFWKSSANKIVYKSVNFGNDLLEIGIMSSTGDSYVTWGEKTYYAGDNEQDAINEYHRILNLK